MVVESKMIESKVAESKPLAPFPIAILFSGNGSNLENLVLHKDSMQQALKPYGVRPYFVLGISNKHNAYGIKRCASLGLDCEVIAHNDFASRALYEAALSKRLRDAGVRFLVLAGFMRILGSAFVREFCCINIHPSFLPLYKGAHAIQESYEGAEDFGGVSVHWVSEELDSGGIIMQEKIVKIAGESLEEYERRIHLLEYKLYPKALIAALVQYVGRES